MSNGRRVALLLAMAVPLLSMAAATSGRTIIVDDDWDGADHSRIQNAIYDATADDIIRIHAGRYVERLYVDKRLSFIGNGSADTDLTQNGSEAIAFGAIVNVISDGVSIVGLHIHRNLSGSSYYVDGLWVWGSNSTLAHNNITDCFHGIYFIASGGHRIENNSFADNQCGSHTIEANGCTFRGNAWAGHYYDIHLDRATNCTLEDNVMNGCGVFIEGSDPDHWGTHSIDTSNLVNGLPVRFLRDGVSSIPQAAGQVILYNVSGLAVSGRSLAAVTGAVQLGFCSDVSVLNITVEDANLGIVVQCSTGIVVSGCRATDITSLAYHGGILVRYSEDCALTDNVVQVNQVSVNVVSSDNISIRDNECDSPLGIQIASSRECHVDGNNILDAVQTGILLNGTDLSVIDNNTISATGDAIRMYDSHRNLLMWNEARGPLTGIAIVRSDFTTLGWNSIADARAEGVLVDRSSSTTIFENTISNCSDCAIDFTDGSDEGLVYHNIFVGSGSSGSQARDDGDGNAWDDGSIGNRWSDYRGLDMDGNGIGDTPYRIAGTAGARDRYPLVDKSYVVDLELHTSRLFHISDEENVLYARITQNFEWIGATVTFLLDGSLVAVRTIDVPEGITAIRFEWSAAPGAHLLRVVLNESVAIVEETTVEVMRKSGASIGLAASPALWVMASAAAAAVPGAMRRRHPR